MVLAVLFSPHRFSSLTLVLCLLLEMSFRLSSQKSVSLAIRRFPMDTFFQYVHPSALDVLFFPLVAMALVSASMYISGTLLLFIGAPFAVYRFSLSMTHASFSHTPHFRALASLVCGGFLALAVLVLLRTLADAVPGYFLLSQLAFVAVASAACRLRLTTLPSTRLAHSSFDYYADRARALALVLLAPVCFFAAEAEGWTHGTGGALLLSGALLGAALIILLADAIGAGRLMVNEAQRVRQKRTLTVSRFDALAAGSELSLALLARGRYLGAILLGPRRLDGLVMRLNSFPGVEGTPSRRRRTASRHFMRRIARRIDALVAWTRGLLRGSTPGAGTSLGASPFAAVGSAIATPLAELLRAYPSLLAAMASEYIPVAPMSSHVLSLARLLAAAPRVLLAALLTGDFPTAMMAFGRAVSPVALAAVLRGMLNESHGNGVHLSEQSHAGSVSFAVGPSSAPSATEGLSAGRTPAVPDLATPAGLALAVGAPGSPYSAARGLSGSTAATAASSPYILASSSPFLTGGAVLPPPPPLPLSQSMAGGPPVPFAPPQQYPPPMESTPGDAPVPAIPAARSPGALGGFPYAHYQHHFGAGSNVSLGIGGTAASTSPRLAGSTHASSSGPTGGASLGSTHVPSLASAPGADPGSGPWKMAPPGPVPGGTLLSPNPSPGASVASGAPPAENALFHPGPGSLVTG
ncbi:hypothetical protein H696_02437 [Fonticula alba]|uniref:Uncharacterized protein n=1 Tax=Fonticula alba TaxID=691883 RepID=A0A058ZC36_FONAL|nr:hypothetical protein H696_02437 [Fonticula alba]KCV71493.1 hypothetical protein H696_02437 [Fonticula alba]|eukprot:XP_009494616.1 hypothetical protein H696_02437 [Fonticula alba]